MIIYKYVIFCNLVGKLSQDESIFSWIRVHWGFAEKRDLQ